MDLVNGVPFPASWDSSAIAGISFSRITPDAVWESSVISDMTKEYR